MSSPHSQHEIEPDLGAALLAAAEASPLATAIVEFISGPPASTRVLWCNAAMADLTGFPAADIVGQPCSAIHDPSTEPSATNDVFAIYRGERAATIDTLNIRPDRSVYWMETQFVPLRSGPGSTWILYCRPTEPDGETEGARPFGAMERAELITRAVNLGDAGISVLDEHRRFEWANAATLRRMGLTLEEARGRPLPELVELSGEVLPLDVDSLQSAQAAGRLLERDYTYVTRTGVTRLVRCSAVLVNGHDGRKHIVVLSHDMAERQRRDAELAAARERAAVMERAIEHASGPVILTGDDLRIVDVNAAFTDLFGYTAAEARGRTSIDLLGASAEAAEHVRACIERVVAGESVEFEGERTTRDGRKLWMQITVTPLPPSEAGASLIAVFRDRTQQHRLELDQSRLTQLLVSALRETRSVALAFDYRNGAVTRTEGVDDILGGTLRFAPDGRGLLLDTIHPDDLELCRHVWQQHWRGLTPEAMADFRIVHPERGAIWVRGISRVVRDDAGAPLFSYGLITDIDAMKRSEAELLDAKSGAEQASQAKSSFLATVSHEIRTPMNVVMGMCQLLMLTELDERQRGYAEMITDASNDLLVLIDDLLDLSRVEAGEMRLRPAPFDLAATVVQVAEAARVLPGAADLTVSWTISPGFHSWRLGDGHRIRQLLANLVGNAVKFTAEGEVAVAVSEAAPGRVRIEVSDTGPGIASDKLQLIFERFRQGGESTLGRSNGIGLGLAICREIVELMGGKIGVGNRPEGGAAFWAELPLLACDQPPGD